IEKTEYQIDVQRNKIIQQSQFLESLLRRTYQQESFSLLENLFSVSSISTLLRQRDTYLTLQNPIYEKTLELKQSRDILFFDKKVLALKQDDLESEKEKFDDQKSIVADQEKKKKTVLKTTQNKENIYQETLAETNRRIAALDKQIREFESKLKFILDKTSIPTKGSGVLNWPLKDIYVTQRFGRTTSSGVLYASGSHSGADFRAAVGTPVYAVADGVVTGAGDTDTACPNISFGKWILIEHDIGLSTTSGHLSKIKVNKGQKVKKGQLIGYSGNTGRSTGPHLHLTVYATHGSDGKKVVEVIKYDSWTCPGKSIVRPSAPTGAYLNPIDYLPPASRNMFKHPRL
ncbi:MAG: M23 family metallopeptidase, partial [Minisyncoccia bacterium]